MLLLRQQLSLDAYIRSLAPAAWFRAGQGITVTGSGVSQWDDQSGNGRHLLQGTDAARPIDLPFSGTRYLYLPGVAGNYASTPDSAANSITGDIDIRVRVALDDWTPAAAGTLVAKLQSGTQRSYRLTITSAGNISLEWSEDGSATKSSGTSGGEVSGFAGGAEKWIRATLDVNNGAGGSDTKFYASDDGSSWSQLGSTDTKVGTTSIFNGTSIVEVGSSVAGSSQPLAGKIYRAIIKNGIDGTTVVDFNPADADGDGDTSFASSTTGETWTINSSGGLPAQIVGRASALFNGTSHYLKCNAFTLNQPTCVLMVVKQVSWTTADALFDGNAVNTNALYQRALTPRVQQYAGLFGTENAGLAVGSVGVVASVANGADSWLRVNNGATIVSSVGTANAGGFAMGARGDGTSPSNIQVYETVIFPIAPSTTQLDRLIAGLMARHGVA